MSKINDLRRKASGAVRSSKWAEAVELYERICSLDSSNASYRNELGDIYLKKGEIPTAIQAFESAAELYMAVGLTNNAIAVHKKILRHSPTQLDSLWGLGEIRRQQNLETDAVGHFMDFLTQSGNVTDASTRARFLDRCGLLMENLPGDPQILTALETIFKDWDQSTDRARVLVLKARLAYESDQGDMVDKYIEAARELYSELEIVPEYLELQMVMNPPEPEMEVEDAAGVEPEAEEVFELDEEIDFGDVQLDAEPVAPAAETRDSDVVSEGLEGEFLDIGFDVEEESASAKEPTGSVDRPPAPPEPYLPPEPGAVSLDADVGAFDLPSAEQPVAAAEDTAAASTTEVAEEASPSQATDNGVDLLDAILADGGFEDSGESDDRQVSSIANDVEGQIASQVAVDDHKGQYDVGIVCMDMGLYDQAIVAFDRAAEGDAYRLKGLEMKGSCLLKMGRPEEALVVFQAGLDTTGHPGRFYLGLLYEVGSCLEGIGKSDEALTYYQQALAIDAGFLDVHQRVERLSVQQ